MARPRRRGARSIRRRRARSRSGGVRSSRRALTLPSPLTRARANGEAGRVDRPWSIGVGRGVDFRGRWICRGGEAAPGVVALQQAALFFKSWRSCLICTRSSRSALLRSVGCFGVQGASLTRQSQLDLDGAHDGPAADAQRQVRVGVRRRAMHLLEHAHECAAVGGHGKTWRDDDLHAAHQRVDLDVDVDRGNRASRKSRTVALIRPRTSRWRGTSQAPPRRVALIVARMVAVAWTSPAGTSASATGRGRRRAGTGRPPAPRSLLDPDVWAAVTRRSSSSMSRTSREVLLQDREGALAGLRTRVSASRFFSRAMIGAQSSAPRGRVAPPSSNRLKTTRRQSMRMPMRIFVVKAGRGLVLGGRRCSPRLDAVRTAARSPVAEARRGTPECWQRRRRRQERRNRRRGRRRRHGRRGQRCHGRHDGDRWSRWFDWRTRRFDAAATGGVGDPPSDRWRRRPECRERWSWWPPARDRRSGWVGWLGRRGRWRQRTAAAARAAVRRSAWQHDGTIRYLRVRP